MSAIEKVPFAQRVDEALLSEEERDRVQLLRDNIKGWDVEVYRADASEAPRIHLKCQAHPELSVAHLFVETADWHTYLLLTLAAESAYRIGCEAGRSAAARKLAQRIERIILD